MFQYTCLNPIAAVGLDNLTEDYTKAEDFAQADAVLEIGRASCRERV